MANVSKARIARNKPARLAPSGHAAGQGSSGVGLTGSEREVFERLRGAIVEQRLPPGAKLTEEELARIYGMSRMRIRRILLSLSNERVVTLFAGRGAFVAKPTPAEARDVFQARRLIETAALAEMAAPASPALIARLRRNVAAERDATRRGDRPGAIRLSGAFHVEIMAEVGNAAIAGILEGLVSRSSLVIALYQRGGAPVCRDDHHALLAEALGGRNFRKAAALMREHLTEIEASLDLDERRVQPVDLREALRPARAATPAPRAKRASRPRT